MYKEKKASVWFTARVPVSKRARTRHCRQVTSKQKKNDSGQQREGEREGGVGGEGVSMQYLIKWEGTRLVWQQGGCYRIAMGLWCMYTDERGH